ncbi:MAG: hypothetical protein L3J16_00040 [Anaerolineales bacterium]|nr:hypothetical protein [Anaerolineales bacterium]
MKIKLLVFFLLGLALTACNMPVSTPHPAQARDATQSVKAQAGNSSQTSVEDDADRTAGVSYGYIQIASIEDRGSEITDWMMGFNYTI